jgi:hypothetical protein
MRCGARVIEVPATLRQFSVNSASTHQGLNPTFTTVNRGKPQNQQSIDNVIRWRTPPRVDRQSVSPQRLLTSPRGLRGLRVVSRETDNAEKRQITNTEQRRADTPAEQVGKEILLRARLSVG